MGPESWVLSPRSQALGPGSQIPGPSPWVLILDYAENNSSHSNEIHKVIPT